MPTNNKVFNELEALQARLNVQEQVALANMLLWTNRETTDEVQAHQMLPPSMATYEFARRDHEDRLREAQALHLVEKAAGGKKPLLSRLSTRLGKFMVMTGYRLMAQPGKQTAATD